MNKTQNQESGTNVNMGTSWWRSGGGGALKIAPVLISLVSVLISVSAYRVGERALRVGQRAYVDVENTNVEVGSIARVTGVMDLRTITFTATLNNA